MAKTGTDKWLDRFTNAVRASDEVLAGVRKQVAKFIKATAGENAGDGTMFADRTRPNQVTNLLEEMITTWLSELWFSPKAIVEAKATRFRPFGTTFQLRMRSLLEQVHVDDFLAKAIRSSMYGEAMSLVTMTPGETGGFTEPFGYIPDSGQVQISLIGQDSMIYDVTAGSWDRCQFHGHKDRVLYDWVKEMGKNGWDKKAIEKLQRNEYKSEDNPTQGMAGQRRENDVVEDEVIVQYFWLPRTSEVVILGSGQAGDLVQLSREAWEGPETGPYERLTLMDVVDNVIPSSYAAQMYALHLARNEMFLKMQNRALAEKDIAAVPDSDTGKIVRDAKDLAIYVSPTGLKVEKATVGGITATMVNGYAHIQEAANRAGHNTSLAGGYDQQSGTLGQDEMLMANVQKVIRMARNNVIAFMQNIVKKAAEYEWNNENGEELFVVNIGEGMSIDLAWMPGYREGEFKDYNIRLCPCMGDFETATGQYKMRKELIAEVIMPLSTAAAQQGKIPNVERITEDLGKFLGIENPEGYWSSVVQQQLEQPGMDISEETNVSSPRRASQKLPEMAGV